VNLSVERGKSMVIIGGSGTGKSVALKSVLGLVKPDQGTITVDGQDVQTAERETFLARFGMLFQGGALFDSLPVWQNVAFRLQRGHLKRPKDEARAIAIEKLRRVGLNPRLPINFPPNYRAACKNAWAWRAPLRQNRKSFSLTNRPLGWTRLCQA
jgi:phospholipid/cholesterol/gamma-HCH transport system ATP-binding protein